MADDTSFSAVDKSWSYEAYFDIFQETSSGDFGIQPVPAIGVDKAPMFRCHTYVLQMTPGFIGKVRQKGKMLQRIVDNTELCPAKDYFKQMAYTGLMDSVEFASFARPLEDSCLTGAVSGFLKDHEDPMRPGFTTARMLSGTYGAVRRRDPYLLSERYEVSCDCEVLAEILRFCYQGHSAFLSVVPTTDVERQILKDKMLKLCFTAELFSVDELFEQVLEWFGKKCFSICGEKNFADAFFHLQHFESQCTEEHSRLRLRETISGDMLARRSQFRTITRDHRWQSLPVEFVEDTLKYDGMPIASEMEVLNLIERWNADAQKPKEMLMRLLKCFRPDVETRELLLNWLTGQGWLDPSGQPTLFSKELEAVLKMLDPKHIHKTKPRHNLHGAELKEAAAQAEKDAARDAQQAANDVHGAAGAVAIPGKKKPPPPPEEGEACFVHYRGMEPVSKGFVFSLGSQQRLVQTQPIRRPGIQRLRVVLCKPDRELWDPEHEVFVGISYGPGKYFGYLCSATAFSGIFSVRALASAAPAPNAPVHLTGSGNKVEFDCAIEVQLTRVNMVVTCKLSIISRNETLTEELFQVSNHTLKEGDGLRYQVVATGVEDQEVDVQLGWVSGGDNSKDH
jgi:hypothetical protein